MKIYDISKEVFSSTVFPGDPVPGHRPVSELAKGDLCNLTSLTLGSHSGTHMDAPCHFVAGGKTIDQVDLARCVGPCQVVEAQGRTGTYDLTYYGKGDGRRDFYIMWNREP